jgi:hypothetical protein
MADRRSTRRMRSEWRRQAPTQRRIQEDTGVGRRNASVPWVGEEQYLYVDVPLAVAHGGFGKRPQDTCSALLHACADSCRRVPTKLPLPNQHAFRLPAVRRLQVGAVAVCSGQWRTRNTPFFIHSTFEFSVTESLTSMIPLVDALFLTGIQDFHSGITVVAQIPLDIS